MKGLIIKDLVNLKKQSLVVVVMLVIYLLYSLKTHDLSILVGVTLVFFALMPITALSYDEKANWDKYSLTMPVSRADMVISKYILGLISLAVALLINTVAVLVIKGKFDYEQSMLIMVTMSMTAINIAILMPIMFKFGVEKGRLLMIVVFLLPVLLISCIPNVDELLTNKAIVLNLMYMLPVISIVLYVISIFISIKIYAKKEF